MDKRTGTKPKSQTKHQVQSQAQKSSAEFAKEICPKEKNDNKKK
ncbi:MAG: hypothetical protein H6Q68_3966 [Firmicutes bacterium]|nr:hypothetical protein [Bacillota bacterium]